MKRSGRPKSFFRRFGWVAGVKLLFWWGEEMMRQMLRFRTERVSIQMIRYTQDRFSLIFWCGLSERLCCFVEEKEAIKIYPFDPWSLN